MLHIGDLHLRRRAGGRENKRFAKIVATLIRKYDGRPKPTLVFTGDITDNGSESEFGHAKRLLAPLKTAGFPMVIAPGNHDVGLLGNTFFVSHQNNFQRAMLGDVMGIAAAQTATDRMGQLFPMVHDAGGALLVGVDSCHDAGFLASGTVGAPQLEALDAVLTAATKPVVVFVHHHPFMRGRAMALVDRQKFMACLRGRVAVLLFGHRHVAEVWRDDSRWDIPLVIAAGKTTKRKRRTKTYELRSVVVGPKGCTTSAYNFRLAEG